MQLDLNDILDELENVYKSLSKELYRLAEMLSGIKNNDLDNHNQCGIIGFSKAIYNDGILEITINKVPEKINLFRLRGTELYKMAKSFWTGTILNAIENTCVPQFDGGITFVLIEIFRPGNSWDTDNSHIKFILDGLRYAGVLRDDTYKDVTYTVLGQADNEEKTVITVTTKDTFIEILKNKLLKTGINTP